MSARHDVYVEDGVSYAYSVLGVTKKAGEKWYNCHACGLPTNESDTVVMRGSRYGVSCGCAKSYRRDITRQASRHG